MSEAKTRLEGRVAAILNARELVINIGRHDGVITGIKFAVLAEEPLEVSDPVSGKVLDTIDREKVRIEAVEVRENITICRTYRVKRVPGGPMSGPWSGLGALSGLTRPPREMPETLSIEDSSLPPPLAEEDSYVKAKDRVIEITRE